MTDVGSFWVRRRAAVKAEEEADARRAEEAQTRKKVEAFEGRDDAEVLEELGLPDPAHLQPGDDFSGFMAREVPEYLRRKALRTLWRSNPILACVDGLNEYDDDYRAAMLLQEPIKTAYQVGKGMLKHIEEMEREAESSAEIDAVEYLASDCADDESTAVVHEAEPAEITERAPTYVEADGGEAEENAPVPMRRMRFHFEEAAG